MHNCTFLFPSRTFHSYFFLYFILCGVLPHHSFIVLFFFFCYRCNSYVRDICVHFACMSNTSSIRLVFFFTSFCFWFCICVCVFFLSPLSMHVWSQYPWRVSAMLLNLPWFVHPIKWNFGIGPIRRFYCVKWCIQYATWYPWLYCSLLQSHILSCHR